LEEEEAYYNEQRSSLLKAPHGLWWDPRIATAVYTIEMNGGETRVLLLVNQYSVREGVFIARELHVLTSI
jgi:hypothetical protein